MTFSFQTSTLLGKNEKRVRRLGEVPWLMPSFHYFQGPTILTFAKKSTFYSSANITNICPYIGTYLKHFTDFRIWGSLHINTSTNLLSVVLTISSYYNIIKGSGHNNCNTFPNSFHCVILVPFLWCNQRNCHFLECIFICF